MSQTDEIGWASRGTRVCPPVTLGNVWRGLTVALNPRTGQLRGKVRAYIGRRWAQTPEVDGLVWDGASDHQDTAMQAVDLPPIVQPPYAPALNPVARFLAELRRVIAGRLYPDLEAEPKAVTALLRTWRYPPARVRQLCGWTWIADTMTQLPTCRSEVV